MNIELREALDKRGWAETQEDKDRATFELLEKLVAKVEELERSVACANNKASCMANGIIPD